MTRRGVIAALATTAAYAQKQLSIDVNNVAPSMAVIELTMHDAARAIVVHFNGQTATVTPQEVMDALLPPKPNHCPACGMDCGPAIKYPKPYAVGGMGLPFMEHPPTEEQRTADKAQPHGIASECPRCRCMFGRQA